MSDIQAADLLEWLTSVDLMLHLLQEFLARKQLTSVPIEVETRTLEEVQEVLSLMDHQQHEGVARLMLDNMTRLDSSKPGV